jgi:uncharacterized protein with HEPN domain
MARPTLANRLRHVLEAIAQVETYLAGKSFADYLVDDMRRHAVERCLEIASEASRHIPSESKGRFPEIPWRGIADFGSVLRHEYPNVINERVWQIVTSDLAPLKSAVEDMLREAEAGSGR